MDSKRTIMNFAEALNDLGSKRYIREYYMEQAQKIHGDIYNRVVILLTMCINRELSIAFGEDDDISVEEYPCRVNEIYSELLEGYQNLNSKVIEVLHRSIEEEDKNVFFEYLNHMVKCLLSGMKYIEKKEGDSWNLCDEQNEWNTRYRREERIRDYMKRLISEDGRFAKFTIIKQIEIPYMYVLAWDLPTLFKIFNEERITKDDVSYLGNLRGNSSIELKHISDNMLDILLHGVQTDEERFEDSEPNVMFRVYKQVSYVNLLPTISIGDRVDYVHDLHDPAAGAKAKKNHILPLIKKEILRKIPLLPMESDRNNFDPVKSMEMMVGLMKEENKTKGYLKSDIIYLKDCFVKICEMIFHWLLSDEADFTRIEKAEARQYLISIMMAANNVPRIDNEENRADHIKKIVIVLSKEWDGKQLADVNVNDKDMDSYVEYAYFSVLKLTRNWNVHNLIDNASISFAVFIFMISIRYLVDINRLNIEYHREYLYEESKLLKFFEMEKIDYEQLDIKELYDEYDMMYRTVNRSAFKNGDQSWARNFPGGHTQDPHQVLNVAGHEKSQIKNEMSENEIFLTFWLSLHFGKAENSSQKIGHTKDLNLIELLEYTFEYQRKSYLLE